MKQVRHRRNHTIAGLALVLAGVLTWLATTQGFVRVDGPSFTAGFAKKLGLELHTGFDYGMNEDYQAVLYGAAMGFVLLGLLLLATRIRFLGLVWRLGALFCLGMTAVFVYMGWTFVSDPASAIADTDSGGGALFRGGLTLAHGLGLIDVTPGAGLYLLTAATVIALLGVLTPAFRRTEMVPLSIPTGET